MKIRYRAPERGSLDERLAAADQPGQHLWVMTAAWKVPDPQQWASATRDVFLDNENLIMLSGPGCLKCEEPWSRKRAARPCPGSTK